MSLEASMILGVLTGSTGSHLSLLPIIRDGYFGRGKQVPEFGGVEFPLDLTRPLGLVASAFAH